MRLPTGLAQGALLGERGGEGGGREVLDYADVVAAIAAAGLRWNRPEGVEVVLAARGSDDLGPGGTWLPCGSPWRKGAACRARGPG